MMILSFSCLKDLYFLVQFVYSDVLGKGFSCLASFSLLIEPGVFHLPKIIKTPRAQVALVVKNPLVFFKKLIN